MKKMKRKACQVNLSQSFLHSLTLPLLKRKDSKPTCRKIEISPAPRTTHSHKPWYNNATYQPQAKHNQPKIKVKKVKNTARDKNQSNAITKEENML